MTLRIFLIIFALAISIYAQNANLKISRIDYPPKIDGVLSVDEWKDATKTELFQQKEPQENDKPTEKTEVYLAFDKEHLYVAFHAYDSNPSGIRSPISKRDNIGNDDFVSIWLDTYDDRRRAYAFRFNPFQFSSFDSGLRHFGAKNRREFSLRLHAATKHGGFR